MTFEEVLARLEGVVRHGSGHMAYCRAHDDRQRSLSVAEGEGGKTLLHCHAGCAPEAVVRALGLELSDLFADAAGNGRRVPAPRPRIVAAYDYVDEEGALLFQVVRESPKSFRQRRPDGNGGWTWSLAGVRRVPYRLPEVLKAVAEGCPIYLPEGERDADTLAALGLTATTNPGGAGKWRSEYAEVFHGAEVVILPDNDEPGRKHGRTVATSLHGVAASVKVLELTGPHKADVSDWLAAGGTAAELERLATEALEWRPDVAGDKPRDRLLARIRTAAELARESSPEVDWTVEGLLARGAITELDGKVKLAGKSTFAAHMVRSVLDGEPFIGRTTVRTRVLWLTEQTSTTFRQVLRRAGLDEREDLYFLAWHDTLDCEWPDVVAAAVEHARRHDVGMLVVDTLPQFARLAGDSENDAGAALAALAPLQEAAGKGLAVLVLRHERKSGGDLGDSGRGSSAFSGAVDVILLLRRPRGQNNPAVRRLEGLARFDETPAELLIELGPEGYAVLGTEAELALQVARQKALAEAPAEEERALTLDALLERMPGVSRPTLRRAVKQLLKEDRLRRIGAGKKGEPYRFYRGEDEDRGEDEEPAAEFVSGPIRTDLTRNEMEGARDRNPENGPGPEEEGAGAPPRAPEGLGFVSGQILPYRTGNESVGVQVADTPVTDDEGVLL